MSITVAGMRNIFLGVAAPALPTLRVIVCQVIRFIVGLNLVPVKVLHS